MQPPSRRRLVLELLANLSGVARLEGEPRDEGVSNAEEGVDRPVRWNRADGPTRPLGELIADQLLDERDGELELAGVHQVVASGRARSVARRIAKTASAVPVR